MSCSALKLIIKYRIHPSTATIQDAYQGNFFYCSTLAMFDIISEIKNLNKKKASHDDGIPVKVPKRIINLHFHILHFLE